MNVCEYLNYFEDETWQRIAFARKTSLNNIRETTLTENLVFNLFRIGQAQSNVLIFESENETRNGNDLEIIIRQNGQLVCFLPTQAKIIHSNNKYPTIAHKVNSIFQIDSLIKYSNLNGGIPLYLLYNYHSATPTLTMYGASLVNANYIKNTFYPLTPKLNWKIPSFSEICPSNAVPISWLCQISNSLNIPDFVIFNGLDSLPIPNITFNNWRLIDTVNELNPIISQELISKNDYSFNPKYRIQIEILTDNS